MHEEEEEGGEVEGRRWRSEGVGEWGRWMTAEVSSAAELAAGDGLESKKTRQRGTRMEVRREGGRKVEEWEGESQLQMTARGMEGSWGEGVQEPVHSGGAEES